MCRTCGKRHNSYDMADPPSNGSHDVNLEAAGSIPFSLGLRSPGKTSPLRSRNLKEYEDQLEHLKKENFSLKLRIYFLEERISHKPIQQDKEELYNANVELKVETEALKKELSDKQELVRQAAALLTNMENKFKEQLQTQQEAHKRETQELRRAIDSMQKELEKYREGNPTDEGVGDLTRLCGLAFSNAGEDDDVSFCKARTSAPAVVTPSALQGTPSALQGVFSLKDPCAYSDGALPDPPKEPIPEVASKRIKELEEEVEGLTKKVQTLEETLENKERMTQALNEDIENLKKEIEDREDKLNDLEQEVNEKDVRVDQLMQELETRHLEIEARDSTIQNLHQDLNKVEPQIEVKVQECMEKDRIIEEKKEQLNQQSKILVEIQITLDEKQKQIAELEESLRQETLKVHKIDEDFNKSLKTIKDMADKIVTRDKEILHLKTQLRKKEKKVKDLIAELKEALDMLQKAKWEAETNGGQDGVKEMAEDENERLWAELEQEKLRMKNLTAEKEYFMEQAKAREEDLRKQKEAVEEELRHLQKEKRSDEPSERDKEELNALKEKLRVRDALQQAQETQLGSLKEDLEKIKAELKEKNEELWIVKKELSKRSFDMHDLIMKGFLGGSEDVKNLTKKLSESSFNRESPLEALKLFMEANKLKTMPEQSLCNQYPIRSNSLSRINEQAQKNPSVGTTNPPKSPKPTRSNSLSLLENALYANMGQKVSNTNQTFNTYIVSDKAESKPAEGKIPMQDVGSVVPSEALRLNHEGAELIKTNPAENHLLQNSQDLSKSVCSETPLAMEMGVPEGERGVSLQFLHAEVSKVRNETQALRKDREELGEKVAVLQEANDRLTSEATSPQQEYEALSEEIMALKKTIQENGEEKLQQERTQIGIVSDYQEQVEILKAELKGVKRRITMQLLQTASAKYQESVKGYKQEITSLRKRLADSHNACDLLRTRLEELVDFLEQVLDMDRKGLIDLSHLSVDQRASLQKSLDDSRSLSHSLSHSLMIGTESLLGESVNEDTASRFFLPLNALPEEVNMSQFELCVAEGNFSHLSMPSIDLTGDTINQSFAAKLFTDMDNKTEEIDAITSKLSQLNAVLESKDEQLKIQSDTVLNLQNQVLQMREEIQAKDQLLKDVKATPEKNLHHSYKDCHPTNSPNETNPSLHLSLLQHSLPSPNFDSRIHEGLLTAVGETSSSDTLPPPPLNVSHEKCENRPKSVRNLSCDFAEEKSTSEIFRKMPRLSDLSFSRSTVASAPFLPVHYPYNPSPGSPLEHQLQPSLALVSPSESEAWSEPDRNVSFARIGLDAANLVAVSHDRSLSRSRMTKSAPFTSESEGDDKPEDTKEGSVGFGTPSSSKSKRRSDAAEVRRLSSKLRTVEQVNETLRAELHIYQTLNEQYNVTSVERKKSLQDGVVPEKSSKDKNNLMNEKEEELSEKTFHSDGNNAHPLPSSLLQEIRSLRIALEEAITKYDLLKDQLEAALAGYLTEEARSLTQRLASVEEELKISQEKLLAATKAEDLIKIQVSENECKTFELGESLAEYMTRNQSLEKKINELNKELAEKRNNLIRSENELKVDRALREEKDWAEREVKDSRYVQMEMEIRSRNMEVNKLQQNEMEKERKIEEQKKYITELEETKADQERRLFKQDSEINNLCENITKLQRENTKLFETEELVVQLKEALQKGESRLLQVTKERFALVGEKTRLQAQLASVSTHATLLQKEVKEFSNPEELTNAEPNSSELLLRLQEAKTTIFQLQRNKELFQSEKVAMQKEIELMQEELLGLKSQLDHVLSRDVVTSSREVRELVGLQMSYSKLKENYSSLECTYANLLAEKIALEEALQVIKTKEKELSPLKRSLKEVTCNRDEVISQLEEERFLTHSLQLQIKDIKSATSFKVSSEVQDFDRSTIAAEFIQPEGNGSPIKSIKGASSSYNKNSISTRIENKENCIPRTPHSRGTLSLPLIDDDTTSGDSPDLGIGSDGQFSSLERLGGCRVRQSFDTMHKGRKREYERMCSEPSHSQLISEINSLREDRECLRQKLLTTNEELNVARAQLSKANQSKEALDKVICRQLQKTHNVLRKAKGNLRHADNQKNQTNKSQDKV